MSSKKISSNESNNSFKVFIRVRPFNQYQLNHPNLKEYLNYDQSQISLKIRNQKQAFTFDKVYFPQSTQQQIFETVADDVIDNAFMGINGTIFCYGQTSSGKTHTIVGDYEQNMSKNQGLLPRVLRDVIQRKNTKIQNIKESNLDIRIKISMVQIYNQKVMDLLDLSKKDLKLRQNKKQGVFIEHVTQKYILNAQEALNYVRLGLQNRTVGRTNLNAYSSRSHMVFTITIHQTNFQTRQAKSAKITLTDLAGSEKISKTGVQGKMLIQAKKINTSLSTLGKVIHALSQSKTTHIPYRDSKLTRLLQQSIGGNSLTKLIINVSPSHINQYQTVTSLRFGSRAKLIKNKPKVNKQYTVQQLLVLLQKAQLKIKQQMKIIEELQQGHSPHNMRRNGGYAGIMYQKPITLHMIGDDDQQFDDSSSIGSHSMVKSVASHQDNCSVSIFGESGVYFNQTTDFQFEAPSAKKKLRKPNLCYSKSMKAIPTIDLQQDDNQLDQFMFRRQQPEKKSQKTVTIMDMRNINENSDNEQKNGIIYEQNQSCKDQSLKNSTGLNFDLPCKSINEGADQEKNTKDNSQLLDGIKLSDITNNESNNNQPFQSSGSNSAYRPLTKSPKDRQKQKQNEMALIRQQIKQQIKEQIKQQIKQQIKDQLKQQIEQQIKVKVKEQFKQKMSTLSTQVETMTFQLTTTQVKLEEVKVKYQETVQNLEQQKQVIKAKDHHIIELKDKYKAKKNQINKEINKLKNFWQVGL